MEQGLDYLIGKASPHFFYQCFSIKVTRLLVERALKRKF